LIRSFSARLAKISLASKPGISAIYHDAPSFSVPRKWL
jgi:hypothetical protein